MTDAPKKLIYDIFDEDAVKADMTVAVKSTIQEMFGKAVEPTYTISDGPLSISNVDMFASVGMTHQKAIGSMVICFKNATLSAILENLYKRELPPGDPACAQGAGEITNVVSAMLKDNFKRRGFALKVALPHVTAGSSFRIPGTGWVLQGKFSGDVGDFDVYLVLQKATD